LGQEQKLSLSIFFLTAEDFPIWDLGRVPNTGRKSRQGEEERPYQQDSPAQLVRELKKELERERQEELDDEARVIAVKKSAPTPVPR